MLLQPSTSRDDPQFNGETHQDDGNGNNNNNNMMGDVADDEEVVHEDGSSAATTSDRPATKARSTASSSTSRNAIDFLTTASELSEADPHVQETEFVFQKMSQRKLERALRGTYENDKPFVMLWVFLTLMLLFGIVAPNFVKDDDTGKKTIDIQLNTNLGFLSLMAVILTGLFVYTLTRVVVVVRWSLYWLFATLSILYLWKRNINLFSSDTPTILLVGFGVMEFLTFAIYVTTNFIYPPFLSSDFFRRHVGVTWWWGLRPVFSANGTRQPWTFTYNSGNPFQVRRCVIV